MLPIALDTSRGGAAPRRPPVAGFTLVEILVVLTVMIILGGLGTTSLVSNFDHARVRSVASILSADLQYAQGLAARQRTPVVVLLDPSLRAYFIRDRATTTIYRQRFVGLDTDYGITTLSTDPTGPVVLFPNGAAGSTTTFTIGVLGYSRQVTLTQAGQIRLVPLPTAKK